MNTKGVKNMRTFILSSFLFVVCTIGLMAAERQPVVEMHADRTIIYPQRMELSGEETLMNILEMYPELMVAGFDDLLKGGSPFDSWQLRMDNVAISGDTRLMLTQIKARNISKIQICDNAGVAKGRTGDGRVIDINLLQAEEGAHGNVSLQGATDRMLSPSLNMHYGSPSTDIWSSVTYKHTDISGQVDNTENLYVQMTNRFSPRDRLLSYITQSSSVSETGTFGNLKHGRSESIMARFRYFHTFNEQGTELLTVVSWQHKNNPNDVLNTPQQTYRRVNSHTNSPLWILELNTPLPVKGLSMMVGYEGDLDVNRYGILQSPVEGKAFDEESTYQLMNNDFYLQLNYLVGPLRLTVGDRVMFYHYQQKGYVDNWSKNSTRNNFHASIIVKADCRHQLQAAYFRKFRNPSAMGVFPELWPNTAGALMGGNPLLDETKINQYKLAYNYGTRRTNISLTGSIYNTSGDEDYWTINGAFYQRLGILSLTGGFDVCQLKTSGAPNTTFADIRLSPTLNIPYQWQVASHLVWYSKDAPRRAMMDNTAFYASVQLSKRILRHWDLQIQWHDIFYSKWAACLAGVMYRF